MSKHKSSRHLIAVKEDAQRSKRWRGMYTEIARRLGLTPGHVRNVAMGLRSSRKVEAALAVEARRREKKAELMERAA